MAVLGAGGLSQDPGTVAKKWATNLGNSVQQISNSVNAVSVNPAQQAANAVQTWQTKMAQQSTAAKWVKGLGRVTLQSWQQAMQQKGIPRIGPGAQAAIPKFTQFLTAFLPYEANITQQVRAMPKGTLQDSINRMTQMVQGLSQFPGY